MSVKKLKMTTKRQVTFPVEVCESLGLAPGDELVLDAHVCRGDRVWILRPAKSPNRDWMYALRRYAQGREHSLEAVRRSIAARKPGPPEDRGGES